MAWRVPSKDDKAFTPPEGYITVYEAHLRSSLRLPLPEELESIMNALMTGVRVMFKLSLGSEWISLSPRTGIKISTVIHDLLKNWKNRFFFVKVAKEWPLARSWGEIPELYSGTPSTVDCAVYAWLTKAIRANPNEFKRDFLVSREESKKVNWGPPSPIQKPHLPISMMNPEESRGVIIRPRRTEEEFSKRATGTPSSSSSHPDYVAAGICDGSGSTARAGRFIEDRLVEAGGVILAQPATRVVPSTAWMESAEEPARNMAEGSRVFIVEPLSRADPPATAPEAAKGKRPAVAVPEAAREEPSAAVDDDEFLDRILDEAAACSTREGAPDLSSLVPPPTGPPPAGTGLEPRPVRPWRKVYESRMLISTFSRKVEQHDRIIADREVEIAWLEAKLAASGGKLREQTAALEAVMASMEAENTELKAGSLA
ncbi:hypothetical protein Nepgr_016926 [Nepenthes gracilis]|uniref:Uncharacterized protein n=1 Tax=Nepenthes gracilis TaxID=150966 RepID=A0AAD3SQM2_NEPGR|nr:hypothetical protein Nepgr_016926 [Nepenthes gracilis]